MLLAITHTGREWSSRRWSTHTWRWRGRTTRSAWSHRQMRRDHSDWRTKHRYWWHAEHRHGSGLSTNFRHRRVGWRCWCGSWSQVEEVGRRLRQRWTTNIDITTTLWSIKIHICCSAVQIFEILNQIVTSVFDWIRNQYNYSKFLNTYHHQFLTNFLLI